MVDPYASLDFNEAASARAPTAPLTGDRADAGA
jgi:hypothetical protein